MSPIRRLLPFAPYVLLSLVIMGPLLTPGFVLTIDMVFTPMMRMPNHVDNTWLLYAILHVLNVLLPADFIQKIMLVAILILSGIGTHRLLDKMRQGSEKYWSVAVYIGATLFMVNPFVYDRFMAGQYGVLLGYSLLPWFAVSLLDFVREPGWRNSIRLSAWMTVMSIVSIHSLGWIVILALGTVLMFARDRERLRRIAKFAGASIITFAIAGAYWLAPAVLGHGRIADSLTTFGPSERQAFATVDTNGTSAFGAVLGLQGFWQDNRQLYILPIDAVSQWGWLQLILLALIITGAVCAWTAERRIALYGVGVAAVTILLALGVGSDWMAAHVPFFAGFREPQKFVAVLALVEMYFLTHGVSWVLKRASSIRFMVYPFTVAVAVLILIYTSPMLWGFDGQLRPARYSADWAATNRFLNAQPDNAKVLFLPWHLYMSYGFAGRIIASPAASFFDRQIIASDNPELAGVAPQTRDAARGTIQSDILPAGANGAPIAGKLRALNVGYVLVAKEDDWRSYAWLNRQAGLRMVSDTQTFRLYRLTSDTIGLHETN